MIRYRDKFNPVYANSNYNGFNQIGDKNDFSDRWSERPSVKLRDIDSRNSMRGGIAFDQFSAAARTFGAPVFEGVRQIGLNALDKCKDNPIGCITGIGTAYNWYNQPSVTQPEAPDFLHKPAPTSPPAPKVNIMPPLKVDDSKKYDPNVPRPLQLDTYHERRVPPQPNYFMLPSAPPILQVVTPKPSKKPKKKEKSKAKKKKPSKKKK